MTVRRNQNPSVHVRVRGPVTIHRDIGVVCFQDPLCCCEERARPDNCIPPEPSCQRKDGSNLKDLQFRFRTSLLCMQPILLLRPRSDRGMIGPPRALHSAPATTSTN